MPLALEPCDGMDRPLDFRMASAAEYIAAFNQEVFIAYRMRVVALKAHASKHRWMDHFFGELRLVMAVVAEIRQRLNKKLLVFGGMRRVTGCAHSDANRGMCGC